MSKHTIYYLPNMGTVVPISSTTTKVLRLRLLLPLLLLLLPLLGAGLLRKCRGGKMESEVRNQLPLLLALPALAGGRPIDRSKGL